MTPKEVLQFARENECTMLDVKFQDFLGGWRHCTCPIQELKEATFEKGYGLDGSGVLGWQSVRSSGLLIVPDADTARIDPFPREKTLSLIGDVKDPVTGEHWSRDPRFIARKAETHLKSTGIGDMATFGPESEFFIFDEVRFDQTRNSAFYIIDSIEGRWNSGRDEQPNLGHKPRHKGGNFPCPPVDSLNDLRTEMVVELMKVGIEVELQHHGDATAGQGEIGIRCAPLLAQGDNWQWFKYVLKNVAFRNGKTVTFMPKPLFEDNGSGVRVRQTLWKKSHNLFAGDEYGGLSKLALWYVGGLLQHAPALCAICNPSTNSYKRLVPGCDAPVTLAYSSQKGSAAVRVSADSANHAAKRIEFRTPDPSCNGYLAFAAMLMAGLDGIQNQIDPGKPLDREAPAPSPETPEGYASTPRSLGDALRHLEEDHEFLLKGDVFTEDVIQAWIDHKRKSEVDAVAARPTPWEFSLYYDC